MRSKILLIGLLLCGLSFAHGENMQPGDIPIKVGSLTFLRRPLAQRSVNTVSSPYFYPSPRLEYFSAYSVNPLDSFRYSSGFFPYFSPPLSTPLGTQVYTHYPYIGGGQFSPVFISLNTA